MPSIRGLYRSQNESARWLLPDPELCDSFDEACELTETWVRLQKHQVNRHDVADAIKAFANMEDLSEAFKLFFEGYNRESKELVERAYLRLVQLVPPKPQSKLERIKALFSFVFD